LDADEVPKAQTNRKKNKKQQHLVDIGPEKEIADLEKNIADEERRKKRGGESDEKNVEKK